jgi:hypothetical protein
VEFGPIDYKWPRKEPSTQKHKKVGCNTLRYRTLQTLAIVFDFLSLYSFRVFPWIPWPLFFPACKQPGQIGLYSLRRHQAHRAGYLKR